MPPLTRRLKFVIAYDGSHYCGWQRQLSDPTIQQILEDTLEQITRFQTFLIGSGRTDSGAHALAQVAHCDIDTHLKDNELKKALNSLLPEDIVVKELQTVSHDFHAQRSVVSKTYIYQCLNTPLPIPHIRNQSWWLPMPLDVPKMNEAAQMIIGLHDFKSFKNRGSAVRTTSRKIFSSVFKAREPFLIYEVEGGGFLKQMIRNLMGAFVRVGRGKMPPAAFQKLLLARNRAQCPPPAPARGLFLKEVCYDEGRGAFH